MRVRAAVHHGGELEVGVAIGLDEAASQLAIRFYQGLDLPQESVMARFIVERTFPEGLSLPANADGASACARIAGGNAECGVTWIHSYVTADKTRTYCIYDAPSPEAIRTVARRNGLPVDRIVEVTVLHPHFYH